MIAIRVDRRVAEQCPELAIGALCARVVNTPTGDELWRALEDASQWVVSTYELLAVNRRPAVAATRRLYKAFGKDPGRYRVASEALCRRVIRGLGLYRLTTVVDAINLVSLRSGYPISGLDASRLCGDVLTLGVGESGEEYHGIGRGLLNIEGMPVYRDGNGGVATPTSDEERTKITEQTTQVQININAFGQEMPLHDTVEWMTNLLVDYAQATDIETKIIKAADAIA